MSETTTAPPDAPQFAGNLSEPEALRSTVPGFDGGWAKQQSARLAPLHGKLDALQQREVAALTATIGSAEASKHVKLHAAKLRDEVNAAKAARDKIATDRTLSAEGRAVRLAELNTTYTATLATLDSYAETAIGAIARTGDPRRVPLTVDQSSHLTMLWSKVDKMPASAVLDHAAEDLALALDEKQPGEVRHHANVRLREFHAGWLARVDESPPNHYKPFAASVIELRALVERHIDVSLGGYRQRTAETFAAELRSDWRYARGAASESGAFDDFTTAIGSPRLYGHLHRSR